MPAAQADQSSLVGQAQTWAADVGRPSSRLSGLRGAALSEAEPVGAEGVAELAPWSHPLRSAGEETNNLGSFSPGALLSASASLSISLSFQMPLSVSRWLFHFLSPLPPQSGTHSPCGCWVGRPACCWPGRHLLGLAGLAGSSGVSALSDFSHLSFAPARSS